MFSSRLVQRAAASASQPLRSRLFHSTRAAAAMALTPEQTAIVKSTAPILKEHGETITTLFYKEMIGKNPELRNVFNMSHQRTGAQPRALASSVLAYATHIDNLAAVLPVVERIAHKHVSLGITPEQYDIVGKHLMEAIATVLGDGLTPEVAEAWTAAYAQLADVFIKRESDLYDAAGDWRGWRSFRIERRENESDSVASFYLAPVDGKPLPEFKSGQYVSVRVRVPELDNVWQCRQYSLSEAPGKNHYRLSIKRETAPDAAGQAGAHHGVVSNMLHEQKQVGDEVDMSFPRGEFFIDAEDVAKADVPLVLMSAGVGVTPLMSILETVLSAPESKTKARPIRWIHAARHSGEAPFNKVVRALAARHPNLEMQVFLDAVREGDQQGRDYDKEGRLDLAALDKETHLGLRNPDTDYFVCGPAPWMLALREKLEGMGVDREKVRMELFGTGEVEIQQE